MIQPEQIRCTWIYSPFEPERREVWTCSWGPEATIAAQTPEVLRGLADLRVMRNGVRVEPEDFDRTLAPGDFVEWSLDVGFAVGPAIAFLGIDLAPQIASLSVAGAGLGTFTAGTAATLATLGNVAFTATLSGLLGGLLKAKPPKPGERESPTYGFSGIAANPSHAGAAHPLVFGEMRVAGPLINLFTESFAQQDEHLYALMMVAGHQVHRIGDKIADGGPFKSANDDLPAGLEIDGEDANSYPDVEAWVRMGTVTQDIIPGFAAPRLQYGIDRQLDSIPDYPSGGGEQAAGQYAFDDAEITDWTEPVGYTTEIEADTFALLIRFPRGLHKISSSTGTLQTREVDFQVRYRRAANGKPLGGYVVLPPFTVSGRTAEAFTFHYGAMHFIDPQDYTAPVPGFYLDLTGSSTAVARSSSKQYSAQVADDVELTYAVWVKTDVASVAVLGAQVLCLHVASSAGFAVSVVNGGGGPLTNPAPLLRLFLGDGSGSVTLTTDPHQSLYNSFQGDTWDHVAVTYRANADADGNGLVRFYVNGKLVEQEKPSQQMTWPTTFAYHGAQNGSGLNHVYGTMDDALLYDRELSPVEVAALYNGGAGQPVPSSAAGLVGGWHFDDTNSGGTTTQDYVGSADATLLNSAAISTGSDTGPVYQDAEGTRLKDRYLIEMQRLSIEDDAEFAGETAILSTVQLGIDDEFNYPGIALLAVRMKATGQTSGLPTMTIPVRGARVPVWDGVDPKSPAFVTKWTRNPAWCLAGAALNVRLGAGSNFSVSDIDWDAFYDAAQYWDELVAANEDKDEDDNPTTHSIAVLEIEVDQASSAIAIDANFTSGLLQVKLDNAQWPADWPTVFDESVTADDAEWWFKLSGVDASGNPSWLTDLEGEILAVGHVLFDPLGGVGGGGGGGQGAFEVWLHPPSDPGTDDTYTPGTGEEPILDRYERRMECDIVLDRTDLPRWEGLRTIAKSARGEPILTGGKLSLWYDAPRLVDNAIGMGNTVAGSFSTTYSGTADRPNVIEGYFLDRARGFERVPITLKHPTVVNPSVLAGLRVAQEQFEGMTRRTQVERHLRYKLNWYHLARRLYQAKGGPDMLGIGPGSRLAVSHDVTGWGESGRLFLSSTAANAIYLDVPVTLVTGTTYAVAVRDSGIGELKIRTVSSAPGTYEPGEALTVSNAFTFTPQRGDVYAFGAQSRLYMDYLVIGTELEATDLVRSISAVQYDEQVYADAWGEVSATVISNLTVPEAS